MRSNAVAVEVVEAEQLRLFEGGPDMRRLQEIAAGYREKARAVNTERAYTEDWRDFERWCVEAGRESLPAREQTVCLYAVALMERLKLSTITRRLAAIRDRHRRSGVPTPAGEQLQSLMSGARRQKGTASDGKAAFTPTDLRLMCVKLQRLSTIAALRDRAMLSLGFCAALRVDEIASLDLSDLRFVKKGVLVRIRRSKTDQEGVGRDVGVFAGVRASTDPIRALKAYLKVRGKVVGALFLSRHGGRLTTAGIRMRVKAAALAAGLDAALYSCHSLRAGFVTTAAENGMPETLIMQRTGHKSVQTVSRYVRPATAFSVDCLRRAV